MTRSTLSFIGYVAFVSTFALAADDDPVAQKLTVAKQDYEKSVERARAELLSDLSKRQEEATKSGDLKAVERARAETRAFEEIGIVPRGVPVTAYEGQLRAARTKLEEVQSAAVTRYTKEGKIELARTAQEDLNELKTVNASTASILSGPGWTDLFNGKDIDSWSNSEGSKTTWSVRSGKLTGSGPYGYLISEKASYENFQLHVVAKVDVGGNSGILFRMPAGGQVISGYEAEINTTDPEKSGSLGIFADNKYNCVVRVRQPPGADRWHTMILTAEGNRFEISIDGRIVTRYIDINRRYTSGAIALQQSFERGTVSFKKVRIKELPAPK